MEMMKNAFMESETEGNSPEDEKEASGVVLTFSKKDAQKVMDYCDKNGIIFEEDTD